MERIRALKYRHNLTECWMRWISGLISRCMLLPFVSRYIHVVKSTTDSPSVDMPLHSSATWFSFPFSVASSNSSHSNHSNPREPRERLETHLESDPDQDENQSSRDESKLKGNTAEAHSLLFQAEWPSKSFNWVTPRNYVHRHSLYWVPMKVGIP